MFAGSSAEYGGEGIEHGNAGSRGLKESCTVYPTCLYGVSKNVFGQVAKQILGDNDMDYLHIRIFPVYGPGEESQHAAPAAAAAAFLSGEKFVCKSPNNLWDFTYIDDVAKDIADLSKSDFIGTVNIASGVATKTADMFRLIARAAHREELLYIENAEAPIRSLVGDISLLEQVLGKRERMPIETGVREMVEWRNSANRSNGTNRRYQ
jgi:nucleoside-diphosphate-sugar epimerase